MSRVTIRFVIFKQLRTVPSIVLLSLLCIYIVWGSTYLAIRYALDSFPPFLIVGIRNVIAGALLFVLSRARGAPMPPRLEWRNASLIGVLLLAGGMAGTALAEQRVSSSTAAIVVASAPIWNALAMGLFKEWPTRFEWLGIIIGLGGVILLMADGNLQGEPLGVVIQVCGLSLWALGSAFGRHLRLPEGGMGHAIEMLAGGAASFIIAFALGERLDRPILPESVVALAYLTIVGSLIAFSAYMIVIKNLRPALASTYAYVNPVVAIGLGVALRGEMISAGALAAIGIILGAVVVMTLARRPGRT